MRLCARHVARPHQIVGRAGEAAGRRLRRTGAANSARCRAPRDLAARSSNGSACRYSACRHRDGRRSADGDAACRAQACFSSPAGSTVWPAFDCLGACPSGRCGVRGGDRMMPKDLALGTLSVRRWTSTGIRRAALTSVVSRRKRGRAEMAERRDSARLAYGEKAAAVASATQPPAGRLAERQDLFINYRETRADRRQSRAIGGGRSRGKARGQARRNGSELHGHGNGGQKPSLSNMLDLLRACASRIRILVVRCCSPSSPASSPAASTACSAYMPR